MFKHKARFLILISALATLAPLIARAQGFVPELQDGINIVGLAVGAGPDYSGSDDYEAAVAPYGRYLFSGQRYIKLLGPELSINLLDDKHWLIGPLIRYRFKRDDDVEDTVVRQMRTIDDTTEAGIFVSYRMHLGSQPLHQLVFSADIAGDTGDVYDGAHGSIRANYFHPFCCIRLVGNIGLSIDYGGSGFNETYYGVTGRDVALYPSLHGQPYEPSAGITGVRIPFGLTAPIGRQWLLSAGGRYERLQGDAEDSPVVNERGDSDQWLYGVAATYLF